MSVTIIIKDARGEWAEVEKSGSFYQFEEAAESKVELFRIGVFAKAIGRSVPILKDWHKDKLIPQAAFQVEGEQCKSWYSASQIVNANRLFVKKYRGRKYTGHDRDIFQSFLKDLRDIWYSETVIIGEDGAIITRRTGT